jgi:hypothetical protein
MRQTALESVENELQLLAEVDEAIGSQAEFDARPFLISHIEEFLAFNDKQLIQRNFEIQKHARWIHEIYGSKRYRLGNFFIQPIEWLLIKSKFAEDTKRSN